MKRGSRNLQLAFLVIVLVLGYFYSKMPIHIVGPSRWDFLTHDGLQALQSHKLTEAETKLTEALMEAQRTPQIRIRRATSLQNLGDLRLAQRRFLEAENLYQQALDAMKPLTNVPPMQRALVCEGLAISQIATGQRAGAEQSFLRSIELSKDADHEDRPVAARIRRQYAGLLLVSGRLKEAVVWTEKASEIEQRPSTLPATSRSPAQD